MKQYEKEELKTRRDFFRQSACASLGVTGLVNALAQMRLMTAAMAQAPVEGDFKALVCLFLNGGNDANNLLVPIGDPNDDELRANYEQTRAVLAIPKGDLLPINVPPTTSAFDLRNGGRLSPMGVHPQCPEIASLFNNNDLAFVCNTGTLVEPIIDRRDFFSGQKIRPDRIGSHPSQQSQWQSSVSDAPFSSGWGGRAADLLNASYNNTAASQVSMSVSLAGVNSFQVGTAGDVSQYIVRSSGPKPLTGFRNGDDDYGNALDSEGNYRNSDNGIRLRTFERLMNLTRANLHEEAHAKVIRSARSTEAAIGLALSAADATGVDFDGNFAGAGRGLGDQLKMIARLIAGQSTLGNRRQIYFCQVGGYDNHRTLLSAQNDLMSELSRSLGGFAQSLKDLNAWDDVTTFTASDFNRTFSPNNLDIRLAGSDHGWGGHAMVMGGSVNGGDLYGHFPNLRAGSVEGSIDTSSRGVWIPDTSVDQYSSVLTKWMGAGTSDLDAIFPNLGRFDSPFQSTSANLGFLG